MELLERPSYAPLWAAARRRVEGNGLSLEGSPLVLQRLTGNEVDAIAGLLGVKRPKPGASLRVSLHDLDRTLRESSIGRGLLDVLVALHGPLIDRRGLTASTAAQRAEAWAALRAHPAVANNEALAGWLDRVRATGLDRRLSGNEGVAAVRVALDVVALLEADEGEHRLAVLAADLVGDSHALDRGRPAGTLAVHALSWLGGNRFPGDAADWRRVWAEAGVACDDLSCDVLVLNLPGFSSEPLRLTLRQVMAWRPPPVRGESVYACENPAVVAAAADHLDDDAAVLVCVDGMPSTAAIFVLRQFALAGTSIRYHGDFDWRGLAIATVVERKVPGLQPWRYGVRDYERAIAANLGAVELAGRPATSPWDADLASAMTSAGLAVYEEQVVQDLVDDVTSRKKGRHA